jgi:hypothetical protein
LCIGMFVVEFQIIQQLRCFHDSLRCLLLPIPVSQPTAAGYH